MPSTALRPERPSQLNKQDARWVLARRIASSSTFVRSEQLPKLLLYVCKMAILERADEISEQRIGVDLYGRSPDYDPSADGIVRSHATRLRQRLELYFSSEGINDTLRIEIPRGGYVPRFYSVEVEPSSIPKPQIQPALSAATEEAVLTASNPGIIPETTQNRSRWIKPFLAGLFLAGALIGIMLHLKHDATMAANRSEVVQSAVERKFWDGLFPANRKTLIVPGDSGLVLYETVTGHEVKLSDYIGGDYSNPSYIKDNNINSVASKQLTADLASRRYTSIMDLGLTTRLSHLPQWSPAHVETVFARDLRPSDAASSNLILIGSRQANPWVSLVEPSMNFLLVQDNGWRFHFLNRHPHAGELSVYRPQDDPGNIGAAVVYGNIAYLPNPGGQGKILVLGGLWMSGTQSAGNFVLDGPQFSRWLTSIANPDGSIPSFELLLATKNLQGSSAYSSIVAKRVAGK